MNMAGCFPRFSKVFEVSANRINPPIFRFLRTFGSDKLPQNQITANNRISFIRLQQSGTLVGSVFLVRSPEAYNRKISFSAKIMIRKAKNKHSVQFYMLNEKIPAR